MVLPLVRDFGEALAAQKQSVFPPDGGILPNPAGTISKNRVCGGVWSAEMPA
jgi:hypothetical protein